MDQQTQASLLLRLKQQQRNETEAEDLRILLKTFRARSDLLAFVRDEVDELLANVSTVAPVPEDVSYEKAPEESEPPGEGSQPESYKRGGVTVAVLGSTAKQLVLEVNGRRLVAKAAAWGGEAVMYDGESITNKLSFMGANHIVNTREGDENVVYEVKFKAFGGFTVKRNGALIFP
jgi:hypothetical protein